MPEGLGGDPRTLLGEPQRNPLQMNGAGPATLPRRLHPCLKEQRPATNLVDPISDKRPKSIEETLNSP